MKDSVIAEVNSQQIQIFPPRPFYTRTHFYCYYLGYLDSSKMFLLYGFLILFIAIRSGPAAFSALLGPFLTNQTATVCLRSSTVFWRTIVCCFYELCNLQLEIQTFILHFQQCKTSNSLELKG